MSNDALLARLAAMETELAEFRKRQPAPTAQAPQGPSPQQIRDQLREAFIRDPVKFAELMGVPKEYVGKAYVVDALGNDAPDQLRNEVRVGPQMYLATATVSNDVAALRQEQAAIRAQLTRESLKNAATDKSRYPNLSTAYAADPSLIEAEIAAGGSAEDIASRMESRFASMAKLFGPKETAPPPASQADADKAQQTTSTQGHGASVNPGAGDPPPLPRATTVGFTEADDRALRDEIVRKFEAGHYASAASATTHPK